jgi:hypothetical protein
MPHSPSPAQRSAPDKPQGTSAPKGKKQLDRDLDRDLEDTFPASDPPSASQPTGNEPAGDPETKP